MHEVQPAGCRAGSPE